MRIHSQESPCLELNQKMWPTAAPRYFALGSRYSQGRRSVSQLNAVHEPLTPEYNCGCVRGVLARCPATRVFKLQRDIE